MNEKKATAPASTHQSSALSFEQILNWFGTFTPQYKFRLMALKRQMDLTQFDALMRDVMAVFKLVLLQLSTLPKGPARARLAHSLIDREFKMSPPTGISCQAGCGACCQSFSKQITEDEADLLAELVTTGQVEIDRTELRRQAQAGAANAPCVFLGPDARCRVYADRPAVCRKYHVTSPRIACETENMAVTPHIELMPELITSAAMSLPDNAIGSMAELLDRRLNPNEAVK